MIGLIVFLEKGLSSNMTSIGINTTINQRRKAMPHNMLEKMMEPCSFIAEQVGSQIRKQLHREVHCKNYDGGDLLTTLLYFEYSYNSFIIQITFANHTEIVLK